MPAPESAPGPHQRRPDETLAHAMLRNEFSDLYNHNLQTLQDFDPNGETHVMPVALVTDFPEAESKEPDTAAHMRETMLVRLGLDYRTLEPDDPARLFQYSYLDGVTTQLRRITRADGAQLTLYTELNDQQRTRVVRLVSNEHTPVLQRRLEMSLALYEFNVQQPAGLGLDLDELLATELTAADVRNMAASVRDIREGRVADAQRGNNQEIGISGGQAQLPGYQDRDKLRTLLVRKTLPAHPLLDTRSHHEYTAHEQAYLKNVGEAIAYLKREGGEEGETAIRQLMADEQDRRLSMLNLRLIWRARIQNVGRMVTASAAAFAGFCLTGVAESLYNNTVEYPANFAGGAMLGSLVGVRYLYRLRKRRGQIQGFTPETTREQEAPINLQVQAERDQADHYINVMRKT